MKVILISKDKTKVGYFEDIKNNVQIKFQEDADKALNFLEEDDAVAKKEELAKLRIDLTFEVVEKPTPKEEVDLDALVETVKDLKARVEKLEAPKATNEAPKATK